MNGPAISYETEVLIALGGFGTGACQRCGHDVDRHFFQADMFGRAGVYCYKADADAVADAPKNDEYLNKVFALIENFTSGCCGNPLQGHRIGRQPWDTDDHWPSVFCLWPNRLGSAA